MEMVSVKWKQDIFISRQKVVICHPFCHKLELRKFLVILAVIEFYARIEKKCLNHTYQQITTEACWSMTYPLEKLNLV